MIKLAIFFRLHIFLITLFINSQAMAYEEPPFNIVHQTDVYEIRHYVDRLAVQATYTSQNSSFRNLFNYISGANTNSEKIKMTTPVTQSEENSKMVMQFYLPSKFTKETIPIPSNPDLEIKKIKEGYFAVIKYSGRSSDKNFIKHSKILYQKLLEDKILIKGSAIKATYNSPFTLPPFRRNEAMFNVDWKN